MAFVAAPSLGCQLLSTYSTNLMQIHPPETTHNQTSFFYFWQSGMGYSNFEVSSSTTMPAVSFNNFLTSSSSKSRLKVTFTLSECPRRQVPHCGGCHLNGCIGQNLWVSLTSFISSLVYPFSVKHRTVEYNFQKWDNDRPFGSFQRLTISFRLILGNCLMPVPVNDWYVETTMRLIPYLVCNGANAITICMVEQLGLAIILSSGPSCAALISGTTSFLSASILQAEELSTTVQPTAANFGAHSSETEPPAER